MKIKRDERKKKGWGRVQVTYKIKRQVGGNRGQRYKTTPSKID